jgi:hypothetical protein
VASPAPSQLDVFFLTANGVAQHKGFASRWGPSLSLGGHWASGPGAVSQGNGSVDAFEVGSDGQLSHVAMSSPTT